MPSRRICGNTVINFEVLGALATKGSGRAFTYRKQDGQVGVRITSDNPTLRAWETRARAEAVAARIRAGEGLIARPAGVRLTAVFRLPRPMKFSTPKYQAGRAFAPPHTVRPDVDKLLRALGDALRGAIYEDDAQIVTLSVGKRYAGLGEGWGVAVTVERLEDANDGEENQQKNYRESAHDRPQDCEAWRRG
jgi:crossover junction endodeoxyribonuclease RusA